MLQLSDTWGAFFGSQAETGMGYTICTVLLNDGRAIERVVVVGGVISSVDGGSEIPFNEDNISRFIVTHDKSRMNDRAF